MESETSDLIERFDAAAPDHARRRAGETSFRLQVRHARRALEGAARLLDVGCGSGAAAAFLDRRPLHGCDRSPAMARAARARGVRVTLADAAALPYRDGAFDGVLSLGLIEYLPDPAAALAEMRRVLAPGGRLVLSAPNPAAPARRLMRLFPRRFDQDVAAPWPRRRLVEAVTAAGFGGVRVRTTNLAPWPGAPGVIARALEPLAAVWPFSRAGTQTVLAARAGERG